MNDLTNVGQPITAQKVAAQSSVAPPQLVAVNTAETVGVNDLVKNSAGSAQNNVTVVNSVAVVNAVSQFAVPEPLLSDEQLGMVFVV